MPAKPASPAEATAGDVRIVPATERDLPQILSLIKSLAEYEKLSDEVIANEKTLRQSLFGDRPKAEVVIAFVGKTAAGFAVYFQSYSTFLGVAGLYLEDLFVKPEWRRRGIGRQLLRYVAELAVNRKCGRLEWSVLDWNAPAISFYRSVGARPMDNWTVYRLAGDALKTFASEIPNA
jgi:GNAT superfamily N-acetyltransferase